MARGIALMKENRLSEAALEFRNAARMRPADPAPVYYGGLIQEAQGNYLEAFKTFQGASAQDRHYAPASLKLAQYLVAAKSFDLASKSLQMTLTDNPRDADAHAVKASLLHNTNDDQGAEREARQALALDPDNLFSQGVLIDVYTASGDEPKLLATIQDAERRHPREVALRKLAVRSFQKEKNTQGVEQSYRALLDLAPKDLESRVDFAKFYLSTGRAEAGEAVLRDGLGKFPRDPFLRRELVAYLDHTRGMQAAEAEIRAAIAQDSSNTDYPFWLAELYRLHGESARANTQLISIYKTATVPAVQARVEVMLAKIALDNGLAEKAEGLAEQALAVHPGENGARLVQAELAFESGRLQNAVTTLRGITHENPADADAAKLLAEALLREGHIDLAVDTLSELLEHNATLLQPLIRLAQLYNLLGLSDRAQEILATVTKLWPEEPLGWESTARVAVDLKDWPNADAAIAKLATLPNQGQLSALLRAMEALQQAKPEQALPQLVAMVKLDPSSGPAERGVDLLVQIGRTRGTCADTIRQLNALTIPTGLKMTGIGVCQEVLGHYNEAANAFDAAINDKVASSEPYLRRASFYVRDRQFDQAIEVLVKGQSSVPGALGLPLMRADLSVLAGHYDDAIKLYSDLLDRDPGLDRAATNLAALIADQRFTDDAQLRKARALADRFRDSDNLEHLDTIGWVCYRQNDITNAISIFERAEHLGTLTPSMQYHYGLVLLAAGRPADARKKLAVAAAANDFPGHEDARQKLASF